MIQTESKHSTALITKYIPYMGSFVLMIKTIEHFISILRSRQNKMVGQDFYCGFMYTLQCILYGSMKPINNVP